MSPSRAPVRADAFTSPAPAKVNLLLRVLGRRGDGFHELETLFQAIGLHDDVTVRRTGPGVGLEVVGADLGPEEENLAHRAARALLDAAGEPVGLHVRLVKRIPAGAGLGGGSSDAAAVLKAGNALLPEPLAAGKLHELGASLGSDVPFFLGGSVLARGTGRGERLEPLPALPEASVVVVLPPVHVATGQAYEALSRWRAGGGERPCFAHVGGAPATWDEVAAEAANDFEAVVPRLFPEVHRALEALRSAGGTLALLSGSGGACFAVFPGVEAAEEAASALRTGLGWPVLTTRTRSSLPEPVATSVEAGG